MKKGEENQKLFSRNKKNAETFGMELNVSIGTATSSLRRSGLREEHEKGTKRRELRAVVQSLLYIVLYLFISVAYFGYGSSEKFGLVRSIYFGVVVATTVG